MSAIQFEHRMAAHCETGTIAGLLNHAGLKLSEPMILGISGGIFFAYLKIRSLPFPTFVVRSQPGSILKYMSKRLKVGFHVRRFSGPDDAQAALDTLLAQGIPAAVQVDMFRLEYIPAYMRVHFNGHFITITGKESDTYSVSDCYHHVPSTVTDDALRRARFARGDMAPKGSLLYVKDVPSNPDLRRPVIDGIRHSCRNMIGLPVPFLGVRGIRRFAAKVTEWPSMTRDEVALAHEIMSINIILEERGTGGAGFRFMFASFLREASGLLGSADLAGMAKDMMANGDHWRELSVFAARMGKACDFSTERFRELQGLILKRADEEEMLFRRLREIAKKLRP